VTDSDGFIIPWHAISLACKEEAIRVQQLQLFGVCFLLN